MQFVLFRFSLIAETLNVSLHVTLEFVIDVDDVHWLCKMSLMCSGHVHASSWKNVAPMALQLLGQLAV